MENEFQVLESIKKNENATQRYISGKTGISLGGVNILIKRLAKKGLLKIERINPRTVKYILTPKGMKERTEAAYRYIISSYKLIGELSCKVEEYLQADGFSEIKEIILFGDKDEIYELLKAVVIKKNIKCSQAADLKELMEIGVCCGKLVIAWQNQHAGLLEQEDIEHMNLFAEIW